MKYQPTAISTQLQHKEASSTFLNESLLTSQPVAGHPLGSSLAIANFFHSCSTHTEAMVPAITSLAPFSVHLFTGLSWGVPLLTFHAGILLQIIALRFIGKCAYLKKSSKVALDNMIGWYIVKIRCKNFY